MIDLASVIIIQEDNRIYDTDKRTAKGIYPCRN